MPSLNAPNTTLELTDWSERERLDRGVAMVTGRRLESRLTDSIVIAPITEGRLDDWHLFHAELTGPCRGAWAESQRRRGITRQVVFLWRGPTGPAAVYMTEGSEAGEAMTDLESSTDSFDIWLRGKFADLHGELRRQQLAGYAANAVRPEIGSHARVRSARG